MMEGMNQAGQEEYIWAMRASAYRESDSELWKLRRAAAMHGASRSTLRQDKSGLYPGSDYQTKVMASLVPDEVIYNVNDYSHRCYDACFLFGDISGFTELCEKYNKTGVSGPSKMTQVLNKYLGAMVQEILSYNGDVLKFSGDAFLACFKASETASMRDSVHEAMDCALVIQKSYGAYHTDVGVVIRVKLAISAGPVVFALIGDEKNSHYVVVGKPIWDVKAGEHISSAGDIMVSPAAWHYVNSAEYIYRDMDDGIHIRLLGVGPNWRGVQKNVRQQKNEDQDEFSESESSSDSLDDSIEPANDMMNDDFLLRPAVNAASRLHIKKELRRFIIAPVMKSIDMDEPFEYLTEMRQSVIVFINVVSAKLESKETVILADQTYKIVCRVVNSMKGCVNKVSLFDKDLMFVVIFGLRGLKHELECQVALRCANECHQTISKLPGVLSTSIGVTTGKTYCGVFGHTLRREYTVISLIVNKAARLMVAYKDKVTCDRETFLHSKLEARNFILQEPKPLKGISHPGPVYEFKEVDKSHDVEHRINPYPLLGREEKLKMYSHLLEKFLQGGDQQYKMFLIEGIARQGKTRLLDEFIYITPPEVPINRFTLTIKDSRVPYQTIRLIFYPPLSITSECNSKQREQKILKMLRNMQVPDMLCILNSLFAVSFKNSELYISLNKQERQLALKKMLKLLSYACFSVPWVIAIDDCEFIDEESWALLDVLLDVKMVFVVATLGKDLLQAANITNRRIPDARVKIMEMKCVDRCYHGALACQILDVYAIPAELEKVIQARSNGNSGWIESFLISLIQDEGLNILKADLRQVNELGLVCPPRYMMTRMSKEEAREWKHIMEEKRLSVDSIKEYDCWNKYLDSCRDSYVNVYIREQMELRNRGETVPVCVLSPNFNVGDVEAELSIDVMILKTFDSLTSYEQLMLKCSAILGSQFPRDMLNYVMSATYPRQTALAVQKLFEIKVLSCAKGDFQAYGPTRLRERLLNPNENLGLKCECRGLKIDDACVDLPTYASCGYMQFRSTMIRDITYNLLTDNQKKEFHQRAIRYLEKETRRCRACGNGFFDRMLGTKRKDIEFLTEKERNKKRTFGASSLDDISVCVSRRSSVFSSMALQSLKKKDKFDVQSIISSRSCYIDERNKYRDYRTCLGITMINRLKNSFSLTRAFSTEDFSDCQCNLILSTTYAQMIDHCRGANDLNKLVEALMEYAYICIISCNIPLALRLLDEALISLSERALDKEENSWKISLIKGKLHTLIGYSRIELGQFEEAERHLKLSLAEHGAKFPEQSYKRRLKTCSLELKQKLGLYICPNSLTKNLDHWETIYANNLSECLAHLCTLYVMMGLWKHAELAASWSLSKALESFGDFKILCTAYSNMIFVAQHYERWGLCLALEVHALRLGHMKRLKVEAEELNAVAKLYSVIFCSRIWRSNLEKSIHIGYIALRICSSVHAVKIILPLLPLLMQCLLMGKHTSNAVSIMQELEFFSNEDTDSSGKVWYFALCISFQLETGYCVVPYQFCDRFFQIEGETWITLRDPDATKRYFIVMWLWCIRNEKWEAASLWCIKTSDFIVLAESDTLANKFSALYLLEGLILFMVCKLDRRNIRAVIQAETEINNLIAAIERAAKITEMILPRLYHLKAYYRYVKFNDKQAFNLLTQAKKFALKYGNNLEITWIEHSENAWNRNLSSVVMDFWRDHCEPDNLLDYHELEINDGKLGLFTLPTPIYI